MHFIQNYYCSGCFENVHMVASNEDQVKAIDNIMRYEYQCLVCGRKGRFRFQSSIPKNDTLTNLNVI